MSIVIDDEVLRLAQAGDKIALSDIYEKFYKLIYYVARRYTNNGYDEEELFAQCNVAFMKAVKKFDPEKASFATYLARCCINEIFMYYRSEKRKMSTFSLNVSSLQDVLNVDFDGRNLFIEDIVPVNYDFEADYKFTNLIETIKEVLDTFAENHRKIILHWLANDCEITQRELRKVTGNNLSQSYVSRIIARFKKKLNNKLLLQQRREEIEVMAKRAKKSKYSDELIEKMRQGARDEKSLSQVANELHMKQGQVSYYYYDEKHKIRTEQVQYPDGKVPTKDEIEKMENVVNEKRFVGEEGNNMHYSPRETPLSNKEDVDKAFSKLTERPEDKDDNIAKQNSEKRMHELRNALTAETPSEAHPEKGLFSISGKTEKNIDSIMRQIGMILQIAPEGAQFDFNLTWDK